MTKVYDNGTLIASYCYDANENREILTYGNGITATYAYNKANMVTSLNNKLGTMPVSSYVYTYYLDGNQETKTDNTGKITTYVYNGLGRLKSEAETGMPASITRAYAYDTAGNRATMTVTGAEAYTKSYSYNANNRLLNETNGYYLYNAHEDVTKLTNQSGVVTKSYDYDAFGVEQGHDDNDRRDIARSIWTLRRITIIYEAETLIQQQVASLQKITYA